MNLQELMAHRVVKGPWVLTVTLRTMLCLSSVVPKLVSQESGACKPCIEESYYNYPCCVEAQQFLHRVMGNVLGTISFSMKQRRSVRDLVKHRFLELLSRVTYLLDQ